VAQVAQQNVTVDSRYRLLSRIGAGGMAEVWSAEDAVLGRTVALKLLHRRFAEDPAFVERFRREASSAAGLQHPNVVSVFDRGAWDGTYYIAMEHLEGRSLKELVREEGPLPPARAVGIVVQVLRAARFAHRRGIVHRDLKPHNVILDEEGRAKVTDFGIARAGVSDATETGLILGTPQYLSPEQAKGEPVSARSDLYSVGILLYELLTGRVPFDGDSPVSIALKQVAEPPVPPSRLNPAVPPALDAVVLRALEKDPAARFPDADAFIAALEHALREPLPPPPPPPVAPVAEEPPPRRRRGGPLLLALLVALLVAGGIAAWLLSRPALVPVPGVVGHDAPAAVAALRAAGFAPATTELYADAPRGRVVGQDPPGGGEAERGARVVLEVSRGPELRGVPDVRGQPADRAERTLRGLGFAVRRQEQSSSDVKEGAAIGTRPRAGQQVPRGGRVTLLVSTGPARVTVPDVTGRGRSSAVAALQAVGLGATVSTRQTDQADPGVVIAQEPDGGATAAVGSLVRIVVAAAPPKPATVTVPSVVGLAPSAAQARLQAAGLGAAVTTQEVSDPSQDGVVVAQDPSGGAEAQPGSTVTLAVHEAKVPWHGDERPIDVLWPRKVAR
jgi:serine/threonine-protein kinase